MPGRRTAAENSPLVFGHCCNKSLREHIVWLLWCQMRFVKGVKSVRGQFHKPSKEHVWIKSVSRKEKLSIWGRWVKNSESANQPIRIHPQYLMWFSPKDPHGRSFVGGSVLFFWMVKMFIGWEPEHQLLLSKFKVSPLCVYWTCGHVTQL